VIVRWSLDELPAVLSELAVERPFLVASPRFAVDVATAGRWSQVPSPHIDVPSGADALLAVGGGSAIDTAKHASAETGLPLVSVPTTYSGAEWTPGYGIRGNDRRMVGGGGGANLAAIVYEVELTLELPTDVSVGTAMNALNHCAEALYVTGRNDQATARALEGARLIADALPGLRRDALLRGAAAGGEALALAGLGLAHAMAQALGGTYGLPHGAMNALCLPPALRFAEAQAPAPVALFRAALGDETPERLAAPGRFGSLRDYGVPESDLPFVAAAAAGRAGNANMPRPATASEVEGLFRLIY
jgi:maleylacetate reductase